MGDILQWYETIIYRFKVRDKQLVMKQVHVLFNYVLVGGWIEWIILTIKACVCVKNNNKKPKSFPLTSYSAVTRYLYYLFEYLQEVYTLLKKC